MKKIILKNLGVIFALSILIICYIVNRYYNNTRIIDLNWYTTYRYDRDNCKVKVNSEFTNVSDVLKEAISGFYKWDQLPLTEGFKNKFSNRNNIVHIDNRVYKIASFLTEQFGENVIQLELCRNSLGVINELFFNTNIVYVYKYKIIDDQLDDIELLDKYEVNKLTGDIIGVESKENLV